MKESPAASSANNASLSAEAAATKASRYAFGSGTSFILFVISALAGSPGPNHNAPVAATVALPNQEVTAPLRYKSCALSSGSCTKEWETPTPYLRAAKTVTAVNAALCRECLGCGQRWWGGAIASRYGEDLLQIVSGGLH
mmetsp:Transcript_51555/g.83637  ORF Transcript_51555/g.83637 Transcript_51555/m.83637 type:complete len:140 (-) Transcript_51555:3-422(-)